MPLRRRVQFTSVRYGERLAEIGARPSIGTVGDSLRQRPRRDGQRALQDRADPRPARTGPWKTVDDVELATLGWVHWHNTSALHGYLGDVPPAEFEAAFYAAQQTDPAGLESNSPSLHQTQGGSIASVATATVCGGFASQVFLAPLLPMAVRRILQPCSDKDKLAVDPATGTGLVSVPARSGIRRPRSPPVSIPSERRVSRRVSSRHQITAT